MKNLLDYKNFIGCDVSKNTLDFAIFKNGVRYKQFEHNQVTNDNAGYKELLKWLREKKVDVKTAVIAFEHTGAYSTPLAEWLHAKGITFVMLHPIDVKAYCNRGRNKTDEVDSKLIAEYVYTMREQLEPSKPEPQVIKTLRALKNERKLYVEQRAALVTAIKIVSNKQITKRTEAIIAEYTKRIKEVENQIKKTIESDESISKNYSLLLSIKGIGMINAVTTIIATGNFTRFKNARQYAKFCSVMPLTRQSGTSVRGGVHVSKMGHKEIKATLTEAARSSILCDGDIASYYQRKRDEGKSYGVVMNAVKFKLICRMFSVIKRQEPYVDIAGFWTSTSKQIAASREKIL